MIMLDTNICIYILKKHPPEVLEKFSHYKSMYISSIVYAELQYGIELSPNKVKKIRQEQLWDFVSLLSIKSWDKSAADNYARIRASLRRQGNSIGNMDMLIAAHAISNDAILVTNNSHEFDRVPNLQLENWIE